MLQVRIGLALVFGFLLYSQSFAEPLKKESSIHTIVVKVEYPEGYKLPNAESDSLVKLLFSDYPTLAHSSTDASLILKIDKPEFIPVSKMAADLVRLELTGNLVLEIKGKVKKSIPFKAKGMEEGKMKAFRSAFGSVRWDEELLEKFIKAFKQSGGVIGPEKDAL